MRGKVGMGGTGKVHNRGNLLRKHAGLGHVMRSFNFYILERGP
jgi:hypothetical protein